MRLSIFIFLVFIFTSCQPQYDYLIQNGTVVDGTGAPGFKADVAVKDGKIVRIASSISGRAKKVIDAGGQVVSPGFIDMLSWACGPILYDGTVPNVIQQGITTAIFGEGWSMGPVNANVVKEMQHWWQDYHLTYDWQTLHDYLRLVEEKGTAVNVASYVGATTLRIYVIGFEDRAPTPQEMEKMKALLRQEMEKGALGVASSLVYAPAFYASTEELIELAKVAAEYNGVYASHIRSEGSDLLEAVKEFISICRAANIRGELYHLKAAGRENWAKLDSALQLLEQARAQGVQVFADIYPYTAGATGLRAMIPPWAKEGGDSMMVERLKNPALRRKIKKQILTQNSGWENFYRLSGGGSGILFSYLSPQNKQFQGMRLSEYAQKVNKDEIDALFDLLIDQKGYGGGIYFLMSEENVEKKMRVPWISFCTDEDAYRPEGLMSHSHPHPRAYGTFPRVLGHYVREKGVLTLEQAIHKMSGLPAQVLGLKDRGVLKEGMAADIVIFSPQKIKDRATYVRPHQFPEGISWVMVNGQVVVDHGKVTGVKSGRALFKN